LPTSKNILTFLFNIFIKHLEQFIQWGGPAFAISIEKYFKHWNFFAHINNFYSNLVEQEKVVYQSLETCLKQVF
jgi:hypothetical protein